MSAKSSNHIYIKESGTDLIIKQKLKKRPRATKEFQCELCNHKYKTERGLLFHMCENKKRLNEKEELYSRIGFMAYIKFYQVLQRDGLKKNPKTFVDFTKSNFYTGFIKFGHYVADMKMNDPSKYIDFLIKNDVPLKKWTDDTIYEMFVSKSVRSEKPDYAIERSIKTMEKWAEEHSFSWPEYFDKAGNFRIISNLKTGKISPWIIYNTGKGKVFLNSLNEAEINGVYRIIDPEFWKTEFTKKHDETNVIKNVLKNAGL